MNGHNITNESLALSMVLVLIAILVSYREKLALEKDIIWSICRAIVQLIIVGYVLKYIFNVNHAVLTLLMVLFICFNAAWNAKKRSKYIDKAFISSFIAITTGAGLTLAVLVFSGSIAFVPMQVIPIAGMVAGNAMVAVGLCYNNMGQRFSSEQQQIQEKLSLGATPKMASARLIRESIRASLIPTVDSAKTVGLVSLPGMMSGLIFAGIDPVKAIKYQIMVTFMLLSTASLSTIIAGYLTYRKFFNARHQLVVTQLKKAPVNDPRVAAFTPYPGYLGYVPHSSRSPDKRSAIRGRQRISTAANRADDDIWRPAHRRYRGRRGSPAASCAPGHRRRLNLSADG